MLDAELKRLCQSHASVAAMLDELEAHMSHPLPPEPPFQVLADAAALLDRAYETARMAGEVRRAIRDLVLQRSLADESAPAGVTDR